MKRALVVVLAIATSVAVVVPAASGARAKKPLKAVSRGWYVFDGVGTAASVKKNGTYTRCTNNPDTPPPYKLGARYRIKNRAAPKGKTKHLLSGPNGIRFRQPTSAKTKPGSYYHEFSASVVGRSTLPPGKYTYRLKFKKKVLTKQTITLVDDTTC